MLQVREIGARTSFADATNTLTLPFSMPFNPSADFPLLTPPFSVVSMRVVAKRKAAFENPRFTMRVWLIGLGIIGEEFKLTRKLLVTPLKGNSAWRYSKPEKEVAADA